MATIAERLVEAEAAFHDLSIGKAVARFRDANGEEVTYSKADISKLESYISRLKCEIAGGSAPVSISPMRPYF